MNIQWFPGHMTRARREVEQRLSIVDFVMELVDARAPLSSQNPMLQNIIKDKPKMLVLMKKDLADDVETKKWLKYLQEKGHVAIAVNVNNGSDVQQIVQEAKKIGTERLKRLTDKGVKQRAIRAMIIGIPNVGKSTLINRLAKKKVAKIGDRPGITKQQSWIKVNNDFDLLDTPGILWPKFEDQMVGYRLAAIGTIRDKVLSLQDITAYVIQYFQKHYPIPLKERYGITPDMDDMWEIFEKVGKKRGALESGGAVNFDKVAELILRDLRTGRLGKISLETVEDLK